MKNNNQLLQSTWRQRLLQELPQHDRKQRHSIVRWLLDNNHCGQINRQLTGEELTPIDSRLEYRYRLLKERYLEMDYTEGYRSLISRLSAVTAQYCSVLFNKHGQKFHKVIINLIQQVVQKLVKNDPYLQRRFERIAQETSDINLRESLSLATVEEYCLHPIKNKPLFIHCLCQNIYQQDGKYSQQLINSRRFNETDNLSNLMEKVTIFR